MKEETVDEKRIRENAERARQMQLKRSSRRKDQTVYYYFAIGAVALAILGAVAMTIMNPNRGLAGTPALEDDTIEQVNKMAATWTAGRNSFFEGWSLADAKGIMGAGVSSLARTLSPCASMMMEDVAIPEQYDVRTAFADCVHPVQIQGNCSSSWAIAAASTLGVRACIKSEGKTNVVLSPQDSLSCDSRNYGCKGGFVDLVWEYAESVGLVSEQCMAYAANSSIPCDSKCTTEQPIKAASHCAISGEKAIQREILLNGPVVVPIMVYTDFLTYKTGVYRHLATSARFSAGHAVQIVGWGVDDSTKLKYWIVANSFGDDWGMNGYAHIVRGESECGIEDMAFVAMPAEQKAESEADTEDEEEEEEEETTEETKTETATEEEESSDEKKSKFQRGAKATTD